MPNTPVHPAAIDRPQFLVHCSAAVTGPDGRVLLVQEAKVASRGKWNLPGGHLHHGESILPGAIRELQEETHVQSDIESLLGIYQGPRSVRFVFRATVGNETPAAGDEILAVKWFTPQEILEMPDGELVSPAMLKPIIHDLVRGQSFPLNVINLAK
jgi:ADP-ribose pyrophosphatase YjhB (NUDIX family)